MEKKLSHQLLDLGFFSALGTSEHPGLCTDEIHVKRGTPNTYDSNNGVTVVYDEKGRPWIIRNHNLNQLTEEAKPELDRPIKKALEPILRQHNVQLGAYVPHSNDGGRFVLHVIPDL